MANPNRTPKTAMAFATELKDKPKPTKQQRAAKLNRIVNASSDPRVGMNKIAQGFIGPVMMRLKYEGIARNVVTEDAVPAGQMPVYDVADEMGRAYFLEPYQAEAVISQYEGKRVQYAFRRIAEFATVQEQDFYELTIDMMDYAVNELKQRIQETEDGYMFALLDVAIDGITPDTPDFSGQTNHVVTNPTDMFQPDDFFAAAANATLNRLDAKNIVMNPADAYDVYRWDLKTVGVAFKDKAFNNDGVPVTRFGDFDIMRSVMCPKNTAYVMAESDYVGRFPVRKSLELRNNDKVEQFSLGVVGDELCNIILLNSGSLYRVEKTA